MNPRIYGGIILSFHIEIPPAPKSGGISLKRDCIPGTRSGRFACGGLRAFSYLRLYADQDDYPALSRANRRSLASTLATISRSLAVARPL